MKTTILLIRHGETEWNKTMRFQGQTDIPLCENGIHQASLLKERLANSIDVIYTSPLSRAKDTATMIAKSNAITPILSDELIEINFGPWEGHSLLEVKEKYPKDFQSWKTDPVDGFFTGGEKSIRSCAARCSNEIVRIANNHKGKRIAIVAHGGILKAGIIGLFDMKMTMYHKLFLNNTSITTITIDDTGNPMLLGLNDHSHIL